MATSLVTPQTPEGTSRTHHYSAETREPQLSAPSHHEEIKTAPVVIPSSPLSEEEGDHLAHLSLSGPVGVTLTAAEKAREKKLRDDPMAIVIGPLFVDCRQCGARIKLSSKSQYDMLHWRTHRGRCLKRVASVPKKQRPKSTSTSSSVYSDASYFPVHTTSPDPPPSAVADELQVASSATPYEHPTPSSPHHSRPRVADAVFEEYLLRSNRKRIYNSLKPPLHWRDWSWDHLLLPQFVRNLDSDSQPELSIANSATF